MVAKIILRLTISVVAVLDNCSKYTSELSLFLHERTQVARNFQIGELFEKKNGKLI